MTTCPEYPSTVAAVPNPPVRFRPATVQAVSQFARSRPWRGTLEERKETFQELHAELCRIYGKETRLQFGQLDGACSGGSYFSPGLDLIELNGKLSVVTYLHEFAHAIGKNDEYSACRWSLNIFRQCFPRSFARCRAEGHVVRRGYQSAPTRALSDSIRSCTV